MINLSELLPDSEIASTDPENLPEVKAPIRFGAGRQVGQREYALQVPGVGSYYAADGNRVLFHAEPGADTNWVRLYLNSQVLVALLHQRKIINFHASSFVYEGLGVMVLGETGAGKSSLTLAFALRNGGFLTDDITPVIFRESVPCIMPLNRKVKIRKDTAEKLGINSSLLSDAESGTGKLYFRPETAHVAAHPLHLIIRIAADKTKRIEFSKPPSAERFSLLRSEICSWEILAGMPETEKAYLDQLVRIVEKTAFIRADRPPETELNDFYEAVREEIASHGLKLQ